MPTVLSAVAEIALFSANTVLPGSRSVSSCDQNTPEHRVKRLAPPVIAEHVEPEVLR